MRKALGWATCLIFAVLYASEVNGQADFGLVAPNANTAVASSFVARPAGPGALFGFSAANTNAAARWVLIFDAATAPVDGTVTPLDFFLLAGTGSPPSNSIRVNYTVPVRLLNGLTFVCSTTGPFTKTASADCGFSAQVQ